MIPVYPVKSVQYHSSRKGLPVNDLFRLKFKMFSRTYWISLLQCLILRFVKITQRGSWNMYEIKWGTVPHGFYLEIAMIRNHGDNLPKKFICYILTLTHLAL